MNICLVDFTEDNGPFEIYPNGSHLFDGSEARAGSRLRTPERVLAPAGSLIIRDARMWHRGTPNRTPDMRPMYACAFTRSWYRFGEAVVGAPPPVVSEELYGSWSDELQKLFRFAAVENNPTRRSSLARGAHRSPPPRTRRSEGPRVRGGRPPRISCRLPRRDDSLTRAAGFLRPPGHPGPRGQRGALPAAARRAGRPAVAEPRRYGGGV